MKKVCAVVVTYNRLHILKQCLSHLLNQKYSLNNIIIVNNHSSDNTKSFLDSLHDNRIISITTHKNLGGAGGFSLGTKIAYERTDSQYFWLMDDDTLPDNMALFNMMDKAKQLKYNFGFLCSNVRWWKDHKPALTNIPQPARDWNESTISNLVKINSTSFVSVLFSRESVSKIGLPISEMFIWGDDVDFTTRLSKNNSKCYLVMDSNVFHKSKENAAYSIIDSPRITFYKYGVRNKIYTKRKYDNLHHLIEVLLKYFITILLIPFCSKNKRIKRLYCMIIGICTGFFFNPTVKFPSKNH